MFKVYFNRRQAFAESLKVGLARTKKEPLYSSIPRRLTALFPLLLTKKPQVKDEPQIFYEFGGRMVPEYECLTSCPGELLYTLLEYALRRVFSLVKVFP